MTLGQHNALRKRARHITADPLSRFGREFSHRVRAVFSEAGTTGLTVLFMGGGGPILAAFSQGRIDGFVLSSPTSDMALLKYNGVLLIDMSRGEFEELRGIRRSR